jgi:hypothetical protein
MSRETKPVCPLPIATTQTARGLIRFYVRLKGELAKANAGEEVLLNPEAAQAAMNHITALMPLLGVDFDPSRLKAVRTYPKVGPLEYGDVRAGVQAVLRAAKGGWMTFREIADGILCRHGLTLSPPQYRHFLQKVREATHLLKTRGFVEPERILKLGENTAEQRWRLVVAAYL